MNKVIFGILFANLYNGVANAEPICIPNEQLENYKHGIRLAYKNQTLIKSFSCDGNYPDEGIEYIGFITNNADLGWIDQENQPLIILQSTHQDIHRKLYISTNRESTMITAIKVEHSHLALVNLGTIAKPDIQKVRTVTSEQTCIPQ